MVKWINSSDTDIVKFNYNDIQNQLIVKLSDDIENEYEYDFNFVGYNNVPLKVYEHMRLESQNNEIRDFGSLLNCISNNTSRTNLPYGYLRNLSNKIEENYETNNVTISLMK